MCCGKSRFLDDGEELRYLFIGALEQLDLSMVLQRLETHAKTGLLVVKQGVQWVEFYFRDGQLVCIGPLRTNATLAQRLIQANIISLQAAQDATLHIGTEPATEMRIALTLMDLGHVRREELRSWATEKVLEVLRVVLVWSRGEIHFAEETVPPAGRLLVGMSITSLLDALRSAPAVSSKLVHNQLTFSSKEEEDISHPDRQTPLPAPPSLLIPPLTLRSTRRVDPFSMRPEMVLMPARLSDQQDQPRYVTLTPQQWRVLTCVNGYTSLQEVCQELGMTPAAVCQIAAELMDEGLLYAVDPTSGQNNLSFSAVEEVVAASLDNGYAMPATVMRPQPLPGSLTSAPMLATISTDTLLQGSNEERSANFIAGRTQAVSAQPEAPTPAPSNAAYAVVGSGC